MARPTIDQLRGIGNVAVPYRWNLSFSQFPSGMSFNSEDLNWRCESTELPKLSSAGKIEVNIRGNKVLQQGIMNYSGTLSLTFVETEDSLVHEFLRQWRELCWQTKTGVQKAKSEYEAVLNLQRLNHADTPIWEYKVVGVFLEDFDLGTLDGNTSDALRTTIVVSFDYFEDKKLA